MRDGARPGPAAAAMLALALTCASLGTGTAVAEVGGSTPGKPRGAAATITAGSAHTCALLGGGRVKCWGYNAHGQLGQGTTAHLGDAPNEMGDLLPPINLGTGRTATAITAGAFHTCALLDDAAVKCWGDNAYGQLGQGTATDIGDGPNEMGDNLPPVDLGTGRSPTAITAGRYHTCAVLDDATVKCWGYNLNGQLGQGTTTHLGDAPNEMGDFLPPVDLGTGRTATAITAGDHHTCAVLDNTTVKCWGYNMYGQLGQGTVATNGDTPNEMGDNLPPVDLGTGRTATAITADGAHTCALLDNATTKCWGYNLDGQLGQGSVATLGDAPNEMGDFLPPINLGPGRTATALAAGIYHTCALLDHAGVKCWGYNFYGTLGQGDAQDRGNGIGPSVADTMPIALGGGTDGLVVPVVAAPAPPTGVKVTTSAGGATVAVSWTAPGDDGGAAITQYRIQRSLDDGLTWSNVVAGTGSTATNRSLPAPPPGAIARYRVAAINAAGVSPWSKPTNPVTGAALVTIEPIRLLDTRLGATTIDGSQAGDGEVPAGKFVEVKIAGRGSIPSNASAVIVNATAVTPHGVGHATLHPCLPTPPNASNLNYVPGQVVPNAAIVKLSDDGSICINTHARSHYLLDVTGYLPAASPITTIDPIRLLDTRPGSSTFDGSQAGEGEVPAGGFVEVKIAGRGSIPPNASAVIVNTTAVTPDANGHATLHPCLTTPPNASNLNYVPGQVVPNAAIVKLSDDGSVCINTHARSHYLLDVTGYLPAASPITTIDPIRLLDTRPGASTIDGDHAGDGQAQAGKTIKIKVTGRGSIPSTATAVIVNATAVTPDGHGHATLYPCTPTPPNASNLNYVPGQVVPNAAIVRLSSDGSICINTHARSHYLLDITGYG